MKKLVIMLGRLKGTKQPEMRSDDIRTIVDRIVDNSHLKLLDGVSDRLDYRRKV